MNRNILDLMGMKSAVVRNLLRILLLLSVVIVSGYLIYRADNTKNTCPTETVCSKCSKVNSCSLPAAKEYKENHQVNK